LKCINCNVTLPDDATECFFCGAKVETGVIRCPKCFVKLENNTKVCPKCGHNFEKEEEKTEDSGKKKLTKKQIALFVSIPLICIALIVATYVSWYSARNSEFQTGLREYVLVLEDSMESISLLANEYDKIYVGQWLIYAEQMASMESTNRAFINEITENRDTITYLASELSEKSVNKKDALLVKNAFENFDKCYVYVVGKKGTYPGYIEGYEKLSSEYKKSLLEIYKIMK